MSIDFLYGWVTPAYFSEAVVDHTFVTSFDSRKRAYADISEVIVAEHCFWHCWGDYHPTAGITGNETGYLGSQQANIKEAAKLVTPNKGVAEVGSKGTVFVYGIDGVCHQVANQVLFATARWGDPLTVRTARGYVASVFIYGTYGRRVAAWEKKKRLCGCHGASPAGLRGVKMSADEFEERARIVVGPDNEEMLKKLKNLRVQARVTALRNKPFAVKDADEINRKNQRVFDDAAALLGREKFIALFGFPPEQRINLVEPKAVSSAKAGS
jgi:hypothetical protein